METSIDLLRKSVDWFLYDNGLRHERVKQSNINSMSDYGKLLRRLILKYFFLVPVINISFGNKYANFWLYTTFSPSDSKNLQIKP